MALDRHGRIEPRDLGIEISTAYLDYAMSVIIGRALPDVRDGLKPVHRRILYAMNEQGLQPDRSYTKSATVVGEVMGKFHPHGDSAIYDALCRLAQDFASRYPLIDGQGNFGSNDFPAAAMRYTESKLTRLATELLRDIDEDTVDYRNTYDDKNTEPIVLPARFPALLVNGSSGIAVGVATNIPPHNLREVVDATIAMIDNPECTVDDLMQHVHGPDFPTGGFIVGRGGIADAYRTGRGRVVMRARAHNEPLKHGKNAIVFTELPYQVGTAEFVKKIAELAKDKVIPEISGPDDVRDESGRDGMRVVVELKRDAVPKVALNKLYKHTQAQVTFGVNAVALVEGTPKVLGLREFIRHYLDHQKEVITRRSRYRLNRAEQRAHILEGLLIALQNLDAVIELIRASKDPESAREGLMSTFKLTEVQARAILDLRLQRLTQLESHKVEEEHAELLRTIEELRGVLGDEDKVYAIIRADLSEIKQKYGDDRRTEIVPAEGEIDILDLIAEEEMVISITSSGYIKRLPVTTYRAQRRGGKGLRGAKVKDEDYVDQLFIASTHDWLLFFTNQGRVYRQKVHELPQAARDARGRHIANVLALKPDEEVRQVFNTRDYGEGKYLLLATRDGMVKKTEFKAYDTILKETGIIAMRLGENDELIGAALTDGDDDVLIISARGQAARFHEGQARPMGRDTMGVKAMTLKGEDRVLGLCVARDDEDLLVVTGNGYGKRTSIADYPRKGRPTQGVRTIKVSDKKGELVTARPVREGQELLLISQMGQVIRIAVDSIRVMGRSTEGVRLMVMGDEDFVAGIAPVEEGSEEPGDDDVVVDDGSGPDDGSDPSDGQPQELQPEAPDNPTSDGSTNAAW